MVLKVDDNYTVYITLQGNKLDLEVIKTTLSADKIALANAQELQDVFAAEPGCAYPFGFSPTIDIYVDPNIYAVDWFLFSPVYSSKTIQAKGHDLKKVFESIDNHVKEVTTFNQD